jgi:hypothetical protein
MAQATAPILDSTEPGIEPDQLLIPFVAIFHSLPGRKVLGFRH